MSKLETIRPVLVLVVVCAVAGLLLGWVYQATAPVIAKTQDEQAQKIYAELHPEASRFDEIPCSIDGCVGALRGVDSNGSVVGYIVVAQAKGYGGMVPLVVGYDTEGTVKSIMIMPNEETPGLGSRIEDDGYVDQYIGKTTAPVDAESVDLISGATISSNAVLQAFNLAGEVFEEVCR